MRCPYCEKEISDEVKFCPNCGADLKPDAIVGVEPKVESEAKSEKKKMKPGKIILIVFLASAILVGLFYLGGFLLYKALYRSNIFDDVKDKVYDYSEEFDEDDIDDAIDKYFSYSFGFDDDDYEDYIEGFSDNKGFDGKYDEFEGTGDFKDGEVTRETNTYKSDFANLSFQLPTEWNIYSSGELNKLYNNEGISKAIVNNKLFVYDLYAEDTITGDELFICFYNKDYFSEYKTLDDYNKAVKEGTEQYAKSYDVDYAKDSTITINGDKYTQIACRISNESVCCYQYDFTRDLGSYYMHINILSYDIDSVGSIIEMLNSKG